MRVYDLLKQEMLKKLTPSVKWISSMAVHPGGDNLILGSYDKKLCWFDMDLSAAPYKTLRAHQLAVRSVAYHPTLPLFASASDDTSVHVYHGRVYDDLMANPLIVPVNPARAQGGRAHRRHGRRLPPLAAVAFLRRRRRRDSAVDRAVSGLRAVRDAPAHSHWPAPVRLRGTRVRVRARMAPRRVCAPPDPPPCRCAVTRGGTGERSPRRAVSGILVIGPLSLCE